jgi:hypothetical protein
MVVTATDSVTFAILPRLSETDTMIKIFPSYVLGSPIKIPSYLGVLEKSPNVILLESDPPSISYLYAFSVL